MLAVSVAIADRTIAMRMNTMDQTPFQIAGYQWMDQMDLSYIVISERDHPDG